MPHGPKAAVDWRPARAEGQGPPRDEGHHRPWLTKGVGHEERVAAGQREGVAVGARGPRAAESALRPRALGEFLWLKVSIHNLAYDLSHDPVYDPAYDPVRDPAKGGCGRVAVIVWRWPWPCGGGHVVVAILRSHNLSRD